MNYIQTCAVICSICVISATLTSCASTRNAGYHGMDTVGYVPYSPYTNYAARLPERIDTNGKKVIIVDPNAHVWGAYDRDGGLVKAGIATAGGDFCEDTGRPCRTTPGTFRIQSLGDGNCISRIYPLPNGGGLMPYCMFFSGGQALHGSPDGTVFEGNASHGCVRMRIADAEWVRYNFASVGTTVVVKQY